MEYLLLSISKGGPLFKVLPLIVSLDYFSNGNIALNSRLSPRDVYRVNKEKSSPSVELLSN